MRLNFIKNVTSHLQCRKAVATCYPRSRPGSDAVEEVFQLQAQRLVLDRRQRGVPDGHGWFDGEANRILTETEGPGGGFLDDGSAFGVYSRLNLYAAAGRAAALSRAKP